MKIDDIEYIAGRIEADAEQAADIPQQPPADVDIVREGVEPYLNWSPEGES